MYKTKIIASVFIYKFVPFQINDSKGIIFLFTLKIKCDAFARIRRVNKVLNTRFLGTTVACGSSRNRNRINRAKPLLIYTITLFVVSFLFDEGHWPHLQ